jgi:type IV pilus assembly protein PilV
MKNLKSISKLRGFTLLESMIALVILSVGMLGIAALYVEGLRAGRTAIYRTTAVALASDMMDRIRANPAARADYALTAAVSNCVNGTVDCSQTELAQEDVSVWEAEVAARMPLGTSADVTVATATPVAQVDTYTITISWPEPGYDANLSYTLRALL